MLKLCGNGGQLSYLHILVVEFCLHNSLKTLLILHNLLNVLVHALDSAHRKFHLLILSSELWNWSDLFCHGFVTADVLVKGLKDGAITPWWRLEGGERKRDSDLPRFGPS